MHDGADREGARLGVERRLGEGDASGFHPRLHPVNGRPPTLAHMIRSLICIAAIALVVSACTSESDLDSRSPLDDAPEDMCDATLADSLDRWRQAGFSGAVAISSEPTRCFEGLGAANDAGQPITANTSFSAGSVSKTVTAVATLQLVDDGVLALDDTAGRWAEELVEPLAGVTVEQLLTHTSGMPQSHGVDYVPLTRAEAIAEMNSRSLLFDPGTDYAYSNSGYSLLALIVERASGRSFRDVIANDTMTLPDGRRAGGFWDGEPGPVSERASGYLPDGSRGESGDFAGPFWALEGNGGMSFSARGLHDWIRALVGGELLSAETLELMMSRGFMVSDTRFEALGWVRFEGSADAGPGFGNAGGGGDVGHDMVFAWLPDSGQIVAVASNRPEVSAEALGSLIVQSLVSGEPLPAPAVGIDVDSEALQAFAGRYLLPDGSSLEVSSVEDGLQFAATGSMAIGAVFAPPEELGDEALSTHEQLVLAFLSGATPQARAELATITDLFGEISSVELAGTGFIDGELRTYVDLVAGGEAVTSWLALDEFGGVSGAELRASAPTRRLVPVSVDTFVPTDSISGDTMLSVRFDSGAGTLRLETSSATIIATRS